MVLSLRSVIALPCRLNYGGRIIRRDVTGSLSPRCDITEIPLSREQLNFGRRPIYQEESKVQVCGAAMEESGHMTGILEKRRQTVKFHWRKYQFTLKGRILSYYKTRGSDDKEGELWGTIDVRDVLSLVCVDTMGSRYPMEMTLRNGKVITLAADCNTERMRWLQAIQEAMVAIRKSARRSSDTPVVRERSDLRGICDWMSKSNPGSEVGSPGGSAANDDLTDLDSFIDQTFHGISFNRQSQLKREVAPDTERSNHNT
ncbi:uncharacterized protein [Engystomops pustulosus]|uniref:uncharacterized protein n=1 Tax=Engystomops pustulosus TaxID=76066 RepID=UPI003AFA01C1